MSTKSVSKQENPENTTTDISSTSEDTAPADTVSDGADLASGAVSQSGQAPEAGASLEPTANPEAPAVKSTTTAQAPPETTPEDVQVKDDVKADEANKEEGAGTAVEEAAAEGVTEEVGVGAESMEPIPTPDEDAASTAEPATDENEPAAESAQEAEPASVGDQLDAESDEEAPTNGGAFTVGYTGVLEGEVIQLADLEEGLMPDQDEQLKRDEMQALIEGSLTAVSQHEIVPGRVISIGEKDVIIDIGFKSDGVIPRNEFGEELETGAAVEVYLERIENYHGQLVLSKAKADKVRRWERIETAFKNESVLEGTVVRRIKGGMIVELAEGLEAFLPGSQIDVRPVRDFDAYLERRMEFKIVKINAANENVVVSHKALIEKELAVQRESILSTMEPGQVLEGTAKNITDFGVFVDLGGVDGLLHITDLSWGRVSHPSEVVTLDEQLKVVVLAYDKERRRISLGLKQLQPHPWDTVEERYKPGQNVEGKVVSITDYGAFVELEKGIEGLVHISEMSWTDHIRHPSQKVSLGQVVQVAVLSIDHDTKKISLGMKQFENNPWEGMARRNPPGTVLKGRVRNITHFGVFVEIEPGIDGLVHISDLSWTKTIRHPGELIKKRQELSVVVLDVDEKRQRISLGHKQIQTNPWTNLSSVYEEGSDHEAKVQRVDNKGLIVELPLEVEGFVPAGELKVSAQKIFSTYQEGDALNLRVIRIDVNQKEIILSETAKERQEARKARDEEERAKLKEKKQQARAIKQFAKKEEATSGPTTLGELSGLEVLRDHMAESEREEAEAAAE